MCRQKTFFLSATILIILFIFGGECYMESKWELTETEIALLASTGFNERRIRNGELINVELKDLEIIRYTIRRMKELYPDISICYTQMRVGDRGSASYAFTAYDESRGPDTAFTVFTEVSGTSEHPVYTCSDTLAGQLMQPEFESYVSTILAGTGLNLHGFSAVLPYPVDESFDRKHTVSQLLSEGQCPPCSIQVYLRAGSMNQQAFDTVVKQLEELFRSSGLTGSILVIGYNTSGDDPLPEAWDSVVFRNQILL